MPRALPPILPALCLSLLLPCALPLLAEETPPAPTPPSAQPAAEAAPERQPLAERSATEAVALEQRLPAEEQQQLQAGAETFLALWQPANVGEPSGVVILLPGAGETADWPQAIGPLRRKLPDAGWHSLSLSLPDPQDDTPPRPPANTAEPPAAPAATDTPPAAPAAGNAEPSGAETNSAETAAAPAPAPAAPTSPEEQRKAHAERVLARVQTAVEFAQHQQAQSIVLLGHGSGAYWAARYLAERQPSEIQNLVLVAAAVPPGLTPPLEELVPSLKLATGDFYYKDQAADRTAALKRQQAGKRQKHPAYIQVAMKALPGNPAAEQEQLYRRIRGWLGLHIKAAAPGQPATNTP